MSWQSDVLPLQSVLLKNPEEAFIDQARLDEQWKALNYLDRPDFQKAVDEHQALRSYLESLGVRIYQLPMNKDSGPDSIYVRDASIATDKGMIICNMGKDARHGEPTAQEVFYRQAGIPILGRIESPGTLEGGDVAWIDQQTLAVARGYRTNDEGIRQLKALVQDTCEEVIVFHSPHFRGPSDVFHLMSVYSPVDVDKAVVYSPLMPVSFREELLRRNIGLIEVPEEEYDSLGCNVLAVAPGNCIIAKGNPKTVHLMREAGLDVFEYSGTEISLKGSGGPTCLTRPLARTKM